MNYSLIQRDVVASLFGVQQGTPEEEETNAQPGTGVDPWEGVSRVNMLLLGSDAGDDRIGTRTDSMIVASINPQTGDTLLFSLPRNLENVPFPKTNPLSKDVYKRQTRKEREPVPAGVVHAISRVESEAKRMSTLVDDLLLLARLDAGRPLDQEDVDLTEIVVNAVSDAHAASPQHKWRLDLPDEPVLVRGDSARLHQIVACLLYTSRCV